jgi:hypothetical protein
MTESEMLTAKTVLDYAISTAHSNPDLATAGLRDLLILRLKLDIGIANVALDRRMAERLSGDLAKFAKKLSAPRHEN